MKKLVKVIIMIVCLCFIFGAGMFLYGAYHGYKIDSSFTQVPLDFNPEDSSSCYDWNGVKVTVYGGFVKGIQDGETSDSLVVRALAPLPTIELKSTAAAGVKVVLTIENINPGFYAANIEKELSPERVAVNTLKFDLSIDAGETKQIIPTQPKESEDDRYIILGDSRDGYETFDQIITQVNAINPVFVIDNGDLVFSGKPNQYRLFDQMASGISTTLCTTLGNHDITGNGRDTYTMLYGPAYYSFDFGSNHFVFLDSSRGYAEKQAIPDEQYAWLEKDLQKAQGKRIFVISHVPPTDPRSGLKPNDIEAYTDAVKKQGGFVEQKLEAYSENETIDHGFRNPQEATRFESIMSQYHVAAVYLSHIHSYYDYTKNGVRYIISGGAGAELLTQNSYYHYLIAKAGASDTLTMIQLPSPANLMLQRYGAAVSLFAQAMYRENQLAVILLLVSLALLIIMVLLLLYLKLKDRLSIFWTLVKDTGKYFVKTHRERFKKNDMP